MRGFVCAALLCLAPWAAHGDDFEVNGSMKCGAPGGDPAKIVKQSFSKNALAGLVVSTSQAERFALVLDTTTFDLTYRERCDGDAAQEFAAFDTAGSDSDPPVNGVIKYATIVLGHFVDWAGSSATGTYTCNYSGNVTTLGSNVVSAKGTCQGSLRVGGGVGVCSFTGKIGKRFEANPGVPCPN